MKLKIWHKMIIGISIPSMIALFGVIITYQYINDIKNRQAVVQIADDLKEQILEIRRNEKNFLLFKNDKHLQSLAEAISKFSLSVGKVPLETSKEIGIKEFSQLKKFIKQFSTLTEQLNDNFKNETSIIEEVRAEGRKLESLAADRKLARELSTSFILNLRRLEKNYMLFRDKKSFKLLHDKLSYIGNVTPICYECEPYTGSIRHLFLSFNRSSAIISELQDKGIRLEEVAGLVASRERHKIDSFLELTNKILLSVLIFFFLAGPLFVYKTASYIAAPIKRLAEIIKKIDAGNLSLRAPLKGQDETSALASSFNMMLDNLQNTQVSLEKSMELLHEKQAQLVESEKRASLGFLVAGVAHELNNPLNNISLIAETISEDHKELSDEEIKDYIQDILMQSERAHSIVENLLVFASARRSDNIKGEDIEQVIKDSLKLVANQLRINEISLNQEFPDKVYIVNGNRSKLEQIFVSIINNAIQAMKNIGSLTVSLEPDSNSKYIVINITDTGPGISESDLKNIFEPFFTTKSPGEGTGLGLSICHTLIKEHKGHVSVASGKGKGTTFTVKLPIHSIEEKTNDRQTQYHGNR